MVKHATWQKHEAWVEMQQSLKPGCRLCARQAAAAEHNFSIKKHKTKQNSQHGKIIDCRSPPCDDLVARSPSTTLSTTGEHPNSCGDRGHCGSGLGMTHSHAWHTHINTTRTKENREVRTCPHRSRTHISCHVQASGQLRQIFGSACSSIPGAHQKSESCEDSSDAGTWDEVEVRAPRGPKQEDERCGSSPVLPCGPESPVLPILEAREPSRELK